MTLLKPTQPPFIQHNACPYKYIFYSGWPLKAYEDFFSVHSLLISVTDTGPGF